MIEGIDHRAILQITTSVSRAIELYPLIHKEGYGNDGSRFLEGLRIHFHKPNHNKAILLDSRTVPNKVWFSLFEDAEKEIMEDDYAFYGIGYETTIKLALKRLQNFLGEYEEEISKRHLEKVDGRRNLYNRDELKQIQEALRKLCEDDKIRLEFVFLDWPDPKEARKRDYTKISMEDLLKVSERDPLDALDL